MPAAAKAYLHTLPGPWVIKTDGLAAGKGVLVTDSLEPRPRRTSTPSCPGDAFGEAGRRVVVEEGLTGPECSLLVLCDGRRLAPLAPAQDFKRLGDADQGPNTGGMGAYSPVPSVDEAMVDRLVDEAVAPLVAALRARGIDYRGVLYAGLMLTPDGPKVLEFNVRFGDPEAQVVLPRLRRGPGRPAGRGGRRVAHHRRPGSSPMRRSAWCWRPTGYPEAPRTGDVISGLSRCRVGGRGHRVPRRHG